MYLFPFANAGAAIIAQVSNMYEVWSATARSEPVRVGQATEKSKQRVGRTWGTGI
jgi:hypothetical protein